MRILVLVKQVPDTWGDRKIDLRTGLLDRDAAEAVVDEISERALAIALGQKDSDKSTQIVALSMGPSSVASSLRKVLALAVDSGIHILDDDLVGADLGRTAEAIAAAVSRAGFDLVVAGNESTDGRGGVLPAMVAERLGVPFLGSLNSVDLTDSRVDGERWTENGTSNVHAVLPAVISVTERSAEPRFPNFKGIMTAKKKPIDVMSLTELGIGLASGSGWSIVLSTTERAARAAGTKIVDDGTAGVELAEFLAAGHLI